MPDKIRYKNPPIVERIIGVYHQIPQEKFEVKLPSWAERIQEIYPVVQPLAEWVIDIENKGGVPFVKSLMPKARLIHVFWQRHPKQKRVRGMRVRPDRLVFHLCCEEGNVHDFDELMPEMERWLPVWADHFDVANISGVTVEYLNRLNAKITPQFVNDNGSLRLSEVLTIFGKFPGPSKGITDPYDCKVRLVIDETKPTYFDLRVRGETEAHNGVRVDFAVKTFPDKALTFSEALFELRAGHESILEHFACFFTDDAKLSFNK